MNHVKLIPLCEYRHKSYKFFANFRKFVSTSGTFFFLDECAKFRSNFILLIFFDMINCVIYLLFFDSIAVKDQAEKMIKDGRTNYDTCLSDISSKLPANPFFLQNEECNQTY